MRDDTPVQQCAAVDRVKLRGWVRTESDVPFALVSHTRQVREGVKTTTDGCHDRHLCVGSAPTGEHRDVIDGLRKRAENLSVSSFLTTVQLSGVKMRARQEADA